jgi:hypothetical protein
MSQKTDSAAGLIGAGMAGGPALAVPFYESGTWLAGVAILGMVVLALSAVNAFFTFKKNIREAKWDGIDRRGRDENDNN